MFHGSNSGHNTSPLFIHNYRRQTWPPHRAGSLNEHSVTVIAHNPQQPTAFIMQIHTTSQGRTQAAVIIQSQAFFPNLLIFMIYIQQIDQSPLHQTRDL